MDNSSIFTASGMTHFKIVAVSLVASIAVVTIGVNARPAAPQATRARNHAPIIQSPIKAGPSMIAAAEQAAEIR